MCEQYASIFGEVLRIRVKKFKQNLRENYSKSTKIAITACKISKISRGSMPPDPLESLLFLNLFRFGSAEKNTLEKNEEIVPSFFIFFATPMCGRDDFFCCLLEFEWKIRHLQTCSPRHQNFFKCGPSCEHNRPPLSQLIYSH